MVPAITPYCKQLNYHNYMGSLSSNNLNHHSNLGLHYIYNDPFCKQFRQWCLHNTNTCTNMLKNTHTINKLKWSPTVSWHNNILLIHSSEHWIIVIIHPHLNRTSPSTNPISRLAENENNTIQPIYHPRTLHAVLNKQLTAFIVVLSLQRTLEKTFH